MIMVNSTIKTTSIGPNQELDLGYDYEPQDIKEVKVKNKTG